MFPVGHFCFRSLSYNCTAFRYCTQVTLIAVLLLEAPVRPAPFGLSRGLSERQTVVQRSARRRGGGRLSFLSQLAAPVQLYNTAKQGDSHCQDHGSPRTNEDGFGEHNQQTFTIETVMTAHAYILPSCTGVTSFLSLYSYLVVICFTFAFGCEPRSS